MYYIHSNVCAQKSLKRTYPGFNPITLLYFSFFLHSNEAVKHTREIALFLAINNPRLTDSTIY